MKLIPGPTFLTSFCCRSYIFIDDSCHTRRMIAEKFSYIPTKPYSFVDYLMTEINKGAIAKDASRAQVYTLFIRYRFQFCVVVFGDPLVALWELLTEARERQSRLSYRPEQLFLAEKLLARLVDDPGNGYHQKQVARPERDRVAEVSI